MGRTFNNCKIKIIYPFFLFLVCIENFQFQLRKLKKVFSFTKSLDEEEFSKEDACLSLDILFGKDVKRVRVCVCNGGGNTVKRESAINSLGSIHHPA